MTATVSSRRSRYWRLAARGLAWSLALLAVVTLGSWIVLESSWVRERARQAVVVQASRFLERDVDVERLDFDPWPLRVTLEEVAIAGAAADAPPFFTAERLSVGFGPGLLGVLRGRGAIDLRSIDLQAPHIRLEIYDDGSTNLPPFVERLGEDDGRRESGIEVRLGAVHVARGRLDVDEHSLPLDLEAVGVRAVVGRLAGPENAYRLELGSRRVTTRLPSLGGEEPTDSGRPSEARPPIEARLALEADFAGGAVEVSRFELTGERVALEGSGDYRQRRLEANLAGRVDLAVLEAVGWRRELAELGGPPSGLLSLDGNLSYDDGAWSAASDLVTTVLTAGPRRVPPLTGSFEAEGRGSRIESLSGSLRGRSLEVDLSGSYLDERLRLAAEGWAEASLAADLDWTDDLDEELAGRLAFDGELELEPRDEPARWELTADVSSDEVRYGTYLLREVSGRLGATPAAVRLGSIAAVVAGGSVTGSVTVDLAPPAPGPGSSTPKARPSEGPSATALAASYPASAFPVVGLDLAVRELDLGRFLEMAELPVEGLAGRLSGELLYVFSGREPREGRGRGRLAFARLDVAPPTSQGRRAIQLAGRVPFEVEQGVFRVERAELRAPEQVVEFSGELDLAPPEGPGPRVAADFELETENPRAVLRLLPALYETDPEPVWEPQRGRGIVLGRLTADPESFSVALDLDLADVTVAATEADRMRGTLAVDSAGVETVDLELLRGVGEAPSSEPTWEGRLEVLASIPFDQPTEVDPARRAAPVPLPFSVDLRTTGWPLADAAPWLPFALPADGLADLEVALRGELEAISGRLEGSVSDLVVADVPVDGKLTGSLAFTPEALTIERAALELPAGRLELSGVYGLESERIDLELSSGALDLASAPFNGWIGAPLGGSITLAAEIGGSPAEPQVLAEIVGSELVLGQSDLGRGGESRLDLAWEEGQLRASGSLLGLLRLEGGGRLDTSGAEVELAVSSDRVGSLLELAVGAEIDDTDGRLEGTLTLSGPAEALEARLVLDRLTLEQPTRRLSNLEPVVVAWDGGVLRLESLFLGEERTASELFVAGTLVGPEGGLDLVVQSTLDARWLALYLPDVTVSGQINMLGVVRGSLADPALDGQAELVDARMIVSGFPHAFERISGLLFFYPNRVVVDSGTARLAGGRVRIDGVVEMATESPWGFELRFHGDDLDLRYPEDWRLQGNVELTLTGSVESRELTGVVTLERAEYQRDFKLGLMGILRTLFERRAETVRETDELLVDTKLNIVVEGPQALHVETNLANVQGSLDLSVRGSLAAPVLLGDVRLLRGGKLDIGGATYEVERGTLSFSNPFRNAPRLDLVASAQVKEYDVRLNVYGPLEKLETTFSSNPPLADVDIVSLLATGSADTLGSFGSGGLATDPAASAESFLAGQVASLAGERVGTLLGLDQVRISPLTAGTADLSTARFTVGKRLGSELFVTYSYDPSRSREEIYELSWQIMPSLALILTRSDEGTFAVDLEWNRTF